MTSVLKGNFQPKTDVKAAAAAAAEETLEQKFEREALKRLGGSIAFVKKKSVVWDVEG